MRVYVPSTITSLARTHDKGGLGGGDHEARAVTPALRESYAEGDTDELEYVVLLAAARDSLHLLSVEPDAPRQRVVLAADVPTGQVSPDPRRGRSAVRVRGPVPVAEIAAVHVDDQEATAAVAAAAAALPAAEAGDDDAAFVVDGADGFELLWFATQEIPDLLR